MSHCERCSECGLPLRGPRRGKPPPKAESTHSGIINLRINSRRSSESRQFRFDEAFADFNVERSGEFAILNFCYEQLDPADWADGYSKESSFPFRVYFRNGVKEVGSRDVCWVCFDAFAININLFRRG